MKIVIIGAGVMGLVSALDLLEQGQQVTLFEAASAPGGLAGSFDIVGIRSDKFYFPLLAFSPLWPTSRIRSRLRILSAS